MAIEKALYQAPQGLDEMLAGQGQPDLEIEIEAWPVKAVSSQHPQSNLGR